ncbi:hypothetical protein, partial [Bradyrhizobium yuanmingense]|uniref:hypothetical protein n=1 Tax=Bradyrhizobium yuanmingense TaxID=108015 RepID=UPI001AEBBEE3
GNTQWQVSQNELQTELSPGGKGNYSAKNPSWGPNFSITMPKLISLAYFCLPSVPPVANASVSTTQLHCSLYATNGNSPALAAVWLGAHV